MAKTLFWFLTYTSKLRLVHSLQNAHTFFFISFVETMNDKFLSLRKIVDTSDSHLIKKRIDPIEKN